MDSNDQSYLNNQIFPNLDLYIEFYDSLSFLVMGRLSLGLISAVNFDTYFLSSIKSTLESIRLLLKEKRINDSYALLRKYYDATNINIYIHLYLEDKFNLDNFTVVEIENWIKGIARLPNQRIYNYLEKTNRLSPIREILSKKDYPAIVARCNDHMHYNFYHNVMLNNGEVMLERDTHLNQLSKDLSAIFIRHISYIFLIKDGYMMSTDYVDNLDVGIPPEEGSQYYVAPFIQEMFNQVFLPNHLDLYEEIKKKSSMKLE